MKIRLVAVFLLSLVMITHAAQLGSVSVGAAASVLLVPPAKVATDIDWASNTAYTAESYANIGNCAYMCQVAGTSGVGVAQMTNTHGIVRDGSVTWYPVMSRHNYVQVSNNGTNAAFLSLGSPARANYGVRLPAEESITYENTGDGLSAISAGGTLILSTMEW